MFIISPNAKDVNTPLRFNWNAGFAKDPFDKNGIYYGSQFLHKSKDKGANWETISPDLTTNKSEYYLNAKLFREHGIQRNSPPSNFVGHNEIWNYHQIGIGENYRMTDIQAALGISQLKRLSININKRNKIAKDLFTSKYRKRVIKPKKGKGSFKRKKK